MLGERSAQRGLFEADTMFADFVGRRNFYGFLASQRDERFRDDDFATLYCPNNGRPSVPPSLLDTALVLQTYDGVSDDEAKQRADYDLRWKVALGIELVLRALAKLTSCELTELAEEVGCARYVHGPSLKGSADVDWTDVKARQRFLA